MRAYGSTGGTALNSMHFAHQSSQGTVSTEAVQQSTAAGTTPLRCRVCVLGPDTHTQPQRAESKHKPRIHHARPAKR